MNKLNNNEIEEKVIQKLNTIKDLELPMVSIYELGLIYKTEVENIEDKIQINIETTTINSRCGGTKSITDLIISAIKSIPEVDECKVKFVFSPKWELTMISEVGLEKLRNADSLNYQM